MTDKTNSGLRLAADKAPSADALAKGIAAMSADELLASMTDEQKTALADSVAPEPKAEEPKADADEKSKADGSGTDKPAADDRTAKVFASEHSVGKERLAGDLLTTSASADEIIGVLAKTEASAADGDAAMADAIRHANSETGSGTDAEASDGNNDNYGWANIHAKTAKRFGRG